MASNPTRQHLRVDRFVRKCETHKVGYATRAEALDGCERGMEVGAVGAGCHLMPYECEHCREWHIRSQRIAFVASEDTSRRDYRRKSAPAPTKADPT